MKVVKVVGWGVGLRTLFDGTDRCHSGAPRIRVCQFGSSGWLVGWLLLGGVVFFYLAPADGNNRDKAEREEVPFLDRDD